jgi:Spy/CpxP family protein refolding chaperone
MLNVLAQLSFVLAVAAADGDCPLHKQHQASAAAPAAATAPNAPAKSPYAGEDARLIKALSEADVKAYAEGTGMGMAKPAELNGYPGPRHVLDASDALGLSAPQRTSIQAAYDKMKAAAVPLGLQVVEAERRLDTLFAKGEATSEEVERLTRQAAELQGRLRAVHLRAHLEIRDVLTPEQVAQYVSLRGYSHQH